MAMTYTDLTCYSDEVRPVKKPWLFIAIARPNSFVKIFRTDPKLSEWEYWVPYDDARSPIAQYGESYRSDYLRQKLTWSKISFVHNETKNRKLAWSK